MQNHSRLFVGSVSLLCILIFLSGCNSMQSTVDPKYLGQTVPVPRIGIAGPGASIATQEFIRQGYTTIDLGMPANGINFNAVSRQDIPFVAMVDAVDTSQSVWDGFYSYSMRVSDTHTGSVIWSASGTFGQGGVWINLQASTQAAMQAMISDFAKTFPPGLNINATQTNQ